jgi:CheY-like chemotaxis protein
MTQSGKTALIIEDAPDVRLILRKILENSGFTVNETDSMEGALDELKTRIPHLLILDLKLPGQSGFAFLTHRKQNPALKAIPVIVVSGANDRDSVHQAIAEGASSYLLKPFVAAQLNQKVRKVLRDQQFLSWSFQEGDEPDAKAEIIGRIVEISEASVRVESQIRIAPEARVEVSAWLGLDRCVLMSAPENAESRAKGFYRSMVHALGLKEPLTRRTRPPSSEGVS